MSDPLNESGEFGDAQWVDPGAGSWMPSIEAGERIGKCEIVRELGSGGAGTVFLARHLVLDVEVALKILPPVAVKDRPQLGQRFIREARLAAKIRHPNLVAVMDADQDSETGLYYIVFEYMEGGSLADLLKKGPLEEFKTARVILDIARALVAAADLGIVHRDIKPANIMLDEKGVAKLADLGLARQGAHPKLTQEGRTVGTPVYMSPDQIRDASKADALDDLYSLGATLYECLTGVPPYSGDGSYSVVGKILTEEPPEPRKKNPKASSVLSAVCRRLMARDRKDRYGTARELVRVLENFVQSGRVPIEKGGIGREIFRAMTILILTAAGLWMMRGGDRPLLSRIPEKENRIEEPVLPAAIKPEDPIRSQTLKPIVADPKGAPAMTESVIPAKPASSEPAMEKIEPVAVEIKPMTAFNARALAERAVLESARGNLLEAVGVHEEGTLLPRRWRFMFWDETAAKNARIVVVTEQGISEIKEGSVDWKKLRMVAYKREEILSPVRVRVDTDQIADNLLHLPELSRVKIVGFGFYLANVKKKDAPVWRVEIFAEKEGEEVLAAEVRVSAESGTILEMKMR